MKYRIGDISKVFAGCDREWDIFEFYTNWQSGMRASRFAFLGTELFVTRKNICQKSAARGTANCSWQIAHDVSGADGASSLSRLENKFDQIIKEELRGASGLAPAKIAPTRGLFRKFR